MLALEKWPDDRRQAGLDPYDVAWMLSAPTRRDKEPAWPECAYFRGLRRQRTEWFSTSLPAITHENPLRLAKLLNLKDLDMAERVGFVPAILACINDLGLIESPQSTKSTQSLSIRYKTGTAQSRRPRS